MEATQFSQVPRQYSVPWSCKRLSDSQSASWNFSVFLFTALNIGLNQNVLQRLYGIIALLGRGFRVSSKELTNLYKSLMKTRERKRGKRMEKSIWGSIHFKLTWKLRIHVGWNIFSSEVWPLRIIKIYAIIFVYLCAEIETVSKSMHNEPLSLRHS